MQVDETICDLYLEDVGRNRKNKVKNNLVIIGPITEEAKAATGMYYLHYITTFILHWYNHCVL